jgi:RND family efflux transporter MFP subunit
MPDSRSRSRLAAALLPLALGACGDAAGPNPRVGPPLVQAAAVREADEGARSFTGVVAARVQSDLGFRVGGKVVARLVDTGQSVRRGQVLMRIDPTDLGLAEKGQRETVAALRARASQASADEARLQGLVEAGAISAQAYDQAKAAADGARAELAAAEASARAAGDAHGYAELKADADGVIVETLAEPGQVVAAGQAVIRLAQEGPREAAVSFPETVRPAIGSAATAEVAGASGAVAARLRQLSDAADPRTRTFDARFVLAGEAARAPLGRTVTVTLAAGRGPGMLVPIGALHDSGSGPGVWILPPGGGGVRWRKVQIARLDSEDAVVGAGLSLGEHVVALGADQLHEGEAVRTSDQAGAR